MWNPMLGLEENSQMPWKTPLHWPLHLILAPFWPCVCALTQLQPLRAWRLCWRPAPQGIWRRPSGQWRAAPMWSWALAGLGRRSGGAAGPGQWPGRHPFWITAWAKGDGEEGMSCQAWDVLRSDRIVFTLVFIYNRVFCFGLAFDR